MGKVDGQMDGGWMSRWEEGREGEREGALRACPACACEGASETMKIRYPKSKRRGLAGSGQSRGLGGEGRRGAALVARTPASASASAREHTHTRTYVRNRTTAGCSSAPTTRRRCCRCSREGEGQAFSRLQAG